MLFLCTNKNRKFEILYAKYMLKSYYLSILNLKKSYFSLKYNKLKTVHSHVQLHI